MVRKLSATIAVCTLAIAFLLPGFAAAQEISDSHLAAAREALAASRSTEQLDVLLPNMGEEAKQQLISNRPDAADKINALVDEATIELAPRRGDLETEIARLYAQVFTEEELKAITEFYRSEAGRKLISETPAIARGMDQASRVWAAGIRRDLGEAVRKRIEEAGLN